MKYTFSFSLLFFLFFFTACDEKINNCDFYNLSASSNNSYGFDGTFTDFFTQSSRWPSSNADITLVNDQGQLSANTLGAPQVLEAWKLFNTQMPYDISWECSAEVTVPTYWNLSGGCNTQVGIGLFAGKPVSTGFSSKVYECNLATIGKGERFVQAQLIPNRLTGNPIDVQRTVLSSNQTTVTLKIQFCTEEKKLSCFINNIAVGESQSIDGTGLDNWELGAGDMMDIGIMGFAENTIIINNYPTIDNFNTVVY